MEEPEQKQEVTQSSVKIIFLAIYNESPHYLQMYNIHASYMNYLKTRKIIPTFYFIICKDLGNKEYLVDDKNYILYIHGRETFVPGILDKTIKAFDIIHNKLKLEYDFIFRTNISTFIHFENTLSYLTKFVNPKTEMYYIGPPVTLQWIDRTCGINDKTYWGTTYCSGTCIILSFSLVENMVNNREKIHYNIIDDVSIGHYVSRVENVKRINIGTGRFSFKPHNLILNKNHLCYMNNFNKTHYHRKFDVENLRKIAKYFISLEKYTHNINVLIKSHIHAFTQKTAST